MTENKNPQKPSKYIFIDAMVIQYAGSKPKARSEAVIKCLGDFEKEGFKIAISEFTGYENLRGLFGTQIEEAAELLSKFENKVISKDVLVMAAYFSGLYHDQKMDGISPGDQIIAATALLEDGLILTENHKDFPSPFFVRDRYVPVKYEIGSHHIKTIDFVLYRTDVTLIARLIRERST